MDPLFDFVVDKEKKTIYITREFAADRDIVWDAFTKAEILVQWVAPQPLRAYIKEMDFREGGRCLTAMMSPEESLEDVTRWSLQEYTRIDPKDSFTSKNSFVDGNFNPLNSGSSITSNYFEAGTDMTTVRIEKIFDSLATVEWMATGGFREGMAEGMKKLDELLRTTLTRSASY